MSFLSQKFIKVLVSRLNLSIQFNWSKSIDVCGEDCSQIIDESVFLDREDKTNTQPKLKRDKNMGNIKKGFTCSWVRNTH